ncbi:MAG: type II secretion system F family protein [Butyrivibrio sp.]|uniref:type II secretion system F family protein n=1 Tax=Butyrivibrio sp. TaxID=28121 RepID=UPI0025B7B9FB|nr:type II secretion system F family protein [Butyrivibrio sp.]MBQ6589358.1 type II secretion system F family protein [Butyrivibrio sp.]
MIICICLIIPVAVVALGILSKDTELSPDINETGIARLLYRISLYLYGLLKDRKKIVSSQKIRANLSTLNRESNADKLEADYYAQKISIVILLSLCGSFLALLLHLQTIYGGELHDDVLIDRKQPGDGALALNLIAEDEEGNELGQFNVTIDEKLYTKAEADEFFEMASLEMEQVVLGENESFEKVTENLNLVQKIDGYPFEVSWKIDNVDVCKYDGEIDWDFVPEEGIVITLTATYKYNESRWEQILYADVIPRQLSAAELIQKEIKELIDLSNDQTRYQDQIKLPSEYKEETIIWREKEEDNSLILLLIMVISGAATFVLKDKDLADQIEKRNEGLLSDYPGLVSQMVLYLGAGMTMRNIFGKLSENYVAKLKAGQEKRFAYEEMLRTTRELAAGKSESDAYEEFGYRCGGQQYTRLSTLLSQNLRKGNSELLRLLNEEARKAQEDRLDRARKAGEEAGTKLLLPMILMLLIVMIIIMIPAYMTF